MDIKMGWNLFFTTNLKSSNAQTNFKVFKNFKIIGYKVDIITASCHFNSNDFPNAAVANSMR